MQKIHRCSEITSHTGASLPPSLEAESDVFLQVKYAYGPTRRESHKHAHLNVCTHTHEHLRTTHAHTHMHARTHTRMHAHTRACTHTHTPHAGTHTHPHNLMKHNFTYNNFMYNTLRVQFHDFSSACTWLIRVCGITHLNVWYDLFICVTCRSRYVYVCCECPLSSLGTHLKEPYILSE